MGSEPERDLKADVWKVVNRAMRKSCESSDPQELHAARRYSENQHNWKPLAVILEKPKPFKNAKTQIKPNSSPSARYRAP